MLRILRVFVWLLRVVFSLPAISRSLVAFSLSPPASSWWQMCMCAQPVSFLRGPLHLFTVHLFTVRPSLRHPTLHRAFLRRPSLHRPSLAFFRYIVRKTKNADQNSCCGDDDRTSSASAGRTSSRRGRRGRCGTLSMWTMIRYVRPVFLCILFLSFSSLYSTLSCPNKSLPSLIFRVVPFFLAPSLSYLFPFTFPALLPHLPCFLHTSLTYTRSHRRRPRAALQGPAADGGRVRVPGQRAASARGGRLSLCACTPARPTRRLKRRPGTQRSTAWFNPSTPLHAPYTHIHRTSTPHTAHRTVIYIHTPYIVGPARPRCCIDRSLAALCT